MPYLSCIPLGCGARLEVKASGNDDDDDDDDDDDESRHGKDVCKASPWLPPLINFQTKSDIKIKFCQPTSKDTESCDVEAARYVGGGQWTNFTDFQRRFWTTKNKKDIYLQWNNSAVTNLTGNLVVINVKCKQKCKGGQRKDFTSCFMFKTAGSFTATKKSAITTSAIKPSTTKPPSTKIVTTRNTTTKSTTETATSKETLPPTTKAEVTTGKGQVTEPAIQIQSTKKHGTGTTLISQTELSTKSSETPPTSSSDINTIPKETPNVICMTTAERSSPGKDKITDKSHDVNNSRRRTVMIVSVVSSLVVVAAMLFITAWLWRKRQRTVNGYYISSLLVYESLTFVHIIDTIIVHKPEDQVHDVDTQENAYQLLVYDGKSKEQAEREQPTYEGLVKGSTATDWGGGEIYTNPTMYQQLDKTTITDENDYLAAYHPLMTQLPSKSEQLPEYDQGYLVLVGEYGKKEETADQEEPYYYKVENSIPQ
ncbi:hypothetical protein AWC38_SpisGene21141 [Stylophora pistillata]|uniref:Uncharacterized protein n=1 Tax=Stylophora pistillata TaxID=50429 RepID=A0A2B4RE67_STYPI|nr:hypothetical protein AWC38_SpisGene21141 [Stylophora pistillata]